MSRAPLAGAVLLLAIGGIGADCSGPNPGPTAPSREFRVELHAPHRGAQEQTSRSHPIADVVYWDGTDRQVDLELVQPVVMSASVQDDLTGLPVEAACTFLDAVGQLGDLGGETDTLGVVTKTLVPTTYDVLVAPECLLGEEVGRLLTDVTIRDSSTAAAPLDWSVAPAEVFRGRVDDISGDPVVGAVVTFFDAERPEYPLGVTVETGLDGEFDVFVPGGDARYDIVISTSGDGGASIGPIKLEDELVPLLGTRLVIEYPVLPITSLVGDVLAGNSTYAAGRVQVEGFVGPGEVIGSDFSGGWYRAEVPTNAQGRFFIDVPYGTYRIRAVPAYGDATVFDTGEVAVDFEPGVDVVDGIEVSLRPTLPALVQVFDPAGERIVGADLRFHMLTAPHYAFQRTTTAGVGGFFGTLPRGLYDVEVIPPTDEETDAKQWSRVRVTMDLTTSQTVLQVFLRRSDSFDGFVNGPAGGVPGVRVMMFDKDTGALVDETITNREVTPGFFRGLLPR
ncbi:MAG: hypothetical protein GY898_31380 [Proteobacteria bacterium]|nr:hypothetical protein [Pseudomonadota bacterium]